MPERTPPENNAWDNAGPMDIGYSKDFAPASAQEAAAAAVEDQAAYDKLGPLTRAAMVASPVRWSSCKMLEFITMRRQRATDPRVDRMVADMIKQNEPGIIQKIRVQDAAAVQAGERSHIERIIDRAMQPRQRGV